MEIIKIMVGLLAIQLREKTGCETAHAIAAVQHSVDGRASISEEEVVAIYDRAEVLLWQAQQIAEKEQQQ